MIRKVNLIDEQQDGDIQLLHLFEKLNVFVGLLNDVSNVEQNVCILEIWAEALNGNPDKLDRYAIKEIRDIMTTLPEWRRSGNKRTTIRPYGRQRYYERSGE